MIFRPTTSVLLRSPVVSPSPVSQCSQSYCHTQNIYQRQQRVRLRPFSTSRQLLNDQSSPTYYEILKMPTTATQAQMKKQFYILSKETHPDMHPDDPSAGERFAKVSEAYSVLGNEEKRRKYDRDVMRPMQYRQGDGKGTGSYAGSRPATGLSKRRGTFRGPPPSFYAHGNPSENTQRQSQQAEEQAGSFRASSYAEPGQWDPAFNSSPVYKTQTAEDKRRNERRAAALAAAQTAAEEEGNFWARFIIVSGVVAVGVGLGSLIVSMNNAPRGGLTRADGTRRDTSRNYNVKT